MRADLADSNADPDSRPNPRSRSTSTSRTRSTSRRASTPPTSTVSASASPANSNSKTLTLEDQDQYQGLDLNLDLVWAKPTKAHPWWPARVLSRSPSHSQVSLFHFRGATFSCPASRLKPFFNPNTNTYARHTHPTALHQALSFASRCLQSQSQLITACNFTSLQFTTCLRDAALSVFAVDFHDSLSLKSWVFALAHNPPAQEEEEEDNANLTNTHQNRFLKVKARKKKMKKKRASDTDNIFQKEPSAAVVQDEEAASGKRERKKSKYLSPPYTDVVGFTIHNQSEEKLQIGETDYQEADKGNLLDYEAVSVREIFTDFLSTGLDPFYLKWKRSAKVLRFFFDKYRDTMFVQGREHGSFTNRECDCQLKGKVKIETDLDNNGLGLSFHSCLTPKMDRSNLTTGPDASLVNNNFEKDRGKEKSDNGAHHPKKWGRPRKEDKCLSSSGSNAPIVQKSEQKMERKEFTSSVSSVSCNNIGEGAVLNIAKGPYEFLEEARAQMMKTSPLQNSYKPTATNIQSQEQSSLKKRKTGNSDNTSSTGPKDSGGKKQKVAQAQYPNPAALLLDFSKPNVANSNGTSLPSRDQLLSTFSKFGLLVETQSDVHQDPQSACVVFARSADAEAAYNSSELGPFGPPFASCRLRYLPPIGANLTPPSQQLAAKPQLSDIRKNLELMISSLTGGSAVPGNGESGSALNGIRPEVRGSLVEEMQGLLTKVEKRLGDSSASSTAPLPGVLPP